MKKLLLAFTLLFAFNLANADNKWIFFDTSKDGKISYHFNVKSIHRTGNKVKMLTLWNYEAVNEEFPDVSSATWMMEFDCKTNKARLLVATAYYGNMAFGDVYDSIKSTDKTWVPRVPGSLGEAELKFACNANKIK